MANWRSLPGAYASLLMFLFAGPASAVVVAPNSSAELAGTTLAAEPYLAGTLEVDELIPFSMAVTSGPTDTISGTVQQRVVREDGTGYLDFYWRILDVSGGPVGHFLIGNFNFPVFDANYRIDGDGLVGPLGIDHYGGSLAQYATFNFAELSGAATLNWGTSSKFFFLHTTATSYEKSAFFSLGSYGGFGSTLNYAAFTPAVPEPQTYAMILAGLGIVALMARRRRKA